MFNKNKTIIERSIMFAIDALSTRIQNSGTEEENATDANSIKVLVDAFAVLQR